jgi:hypothetical protein
MSHENWFNLFSSRPHATSEISRQVGLHRTIPLVANRHLGPGTNFYYRFSPDQAGQPGNQVARARERRNLPTRRVIIPTGRLGFATTVAALAPRFEPGLARLLYSHPLVHIVLSHAAPSHLGRCPSTDMIEAFSITFRRPAKSGAVI